MIMLLDIFQKIGLIIFLIYASINIVLNMIHGRATLIGTGGTIIVPGLVVLLIATLNLSFLFTGIHIIETVALFLVLIGMIFIQCAVRHLGNNRDDFWTAQYKPKIRTLVQVGPYRYIRHPIYTGMFITFTGLLILFFHLTTLAITATYFISVIYTAISEEKFMLTRFPEYSEYTKRTGMFFPKFL